MDIYSIGSKRMIDDATKIIPVTSIIDVPEGGTVLSLHSTDTINQILTDIKVSTEKGLNFIGCNQNIFQIFNDKGLTKEYLGKLGFPVAKGMNSLGYIEQIENTILTYNLKFPILIKEVDNTGGKGIHFINSIDDLKKINLDSFGKYVIEEFIEGEEYSCMIFVNNGKIVVYPPIKKGKTGINSKGKIIHALEKVRSNITLTNISKKIRNLALEIGCIKGVNGFIDFDFIFDENEQKLKIIEINPRVSGITDISFLSSNFNLNDIINLLENNDYGSCNLIRTNIIIEYPVIFEKENFEEIELQIEGGKVIKSTILKKFPPYMQKFLIEFDSIDSYNKFVNNLKNNEYKL